jgi:hypothetical protein
MMKIVESLSRLPFGTASEILNQLEADGFVIAPKVPTEPMLVAARDWSAGKYGKPVGDDGASGCWNAMLAAANQ